MISYHYNICALQIQVDAEKSVILEPHAQVFSTPAAPPDIRITLRSAPRVETGSAVPSSLSRERPVWREGREVLRCCWDLFRGEIHFGCRYSLDSPHRAEGVVRAGDWDWATRPSYLWPGLMLNYLLLHQRGLIFHASLIAAGERAVLFTAPSGTGKSTQAELWRVHRGAEIINGDKAGVTLREVPMAHGVPFSGTSGICKNISLPLGAVVVLSQAPENSLRRLPPSQAAAALFPNLFVDSAIPEEWQLALRLILDLVEAVPVFALACTPDERAVEMLEQALSQL